MNILCYSEWAQQLKFVTRIFFIMYGGRRESRNAVPIEVKVAAISKIQSGRITITFPLQNSRY